MCFSNLITITLCVVNDHLTCVFTQPIERAVVNLDNAYNIPNLDIQGIPCKTHRPSNTVFRGPGTVQGSHFIENILDRIASFLNKDPVHVNRNSYAHLTLYMIHILLHAACYTFMLHRI